MLFLSAGVAGDCETFDVAAGDWTEVNCKCIMHSDLLSHLFASKWHLACPTRIREHCRSGWEEWKIVMAQLSQSGTHSIYGHLRQTHISLALSTISYGWQKCAWRTLFIAAVLVVGTFSESGSPHLQLCTYFWAHQASECSSKLKVFVYEKETIFFLYFLDSSLLYHIQGTASPPSPSPNPLLPLLLPRYNALFFPSNETWHPSDINWTWYNMMQ